jgi:hypothetical protein
MFAAAAFSSYPHCNSLTFILILSSHLPPHYPSGLYLGFPNKILYAFLIASMHATFPAHLILPDVVTLKTYGEEYKS